MKPELMVRKLIHGMGYRYRLHRRDLPGKPDMVFPSKKKVVFVHGCFWHQHKSSKCKIVRMPKSNVGFWADKLRRNVRRDAKSLRELKKLGWSSLVVWECETKKATALSKRIQQFLKGNGAVDRN